MAVPANVQRSSAYAELWGVVDGAVVDAFKSHPDYLTPKGQRSARTSVVKRVCGTVLGFAAQAAKGRPNQPAVMEKRAVSPVAPASPAFGDAKVGAGQAASATPNCRIGKVRFKTRSRYRKVGIFDLTTSALIASLKAKEGRK